MGSACFGILPMDEGEIHLRGVGSAGVSEMRMVLNREIPAEEDFRQQWNDLVEKMEHPEVFYTWEWARAVAQAYGAVLQPILFAAYRQESLVGIAALATDARGQVCFL